MTLQIEAAGITHRGTVRENNEDCIAIGYWTSQETMEAARDHDVRTRFDPVSLNPYLSWTDPDSVDHVVWYLDGATAYNQLRVGKDLGVAGAGRQLRCEFERVTEVAAGR